VKSAFVRVTALVLSALFLTAAAAAAIELWRAGGDLLGNPKLKIAAGWLASGAIFLAIGLRGWRQRRRNATDELKARQ
jgi:uncharacterized membrane protein